MTADFSKYKHRAVFDFFQEINMIPRESGNEKAISDYLKSFAEKRNLYVRQDEFNNIVIKKSGTSGYEKRPAVIIQGHMDMVCVKGNSSSHDFLKDPIKMYIDGDLIKAEDTTLGADNGIAIAMGLAILNSNEIPHPPIEFVVTTDEEVGLTGAVRMKTDDLTAKYFINLDSEEEGEFVVSCAGGVRLSFIQKIQKVKTDAEGKKCFKIEIKDLAGGHSGMEIDKNRANSNRLMGRVLLALKNNNWEVAEIKGGVKDNVIPSYAQIKILVAGENEKEMRNAVSALEKDFRIEFGSVEKDLKLVITEEEFSCSEVLSKKSLDEAVFIILNTQNGIQTMSPDILGLVQSSLNLGVVEQKNDEIMYIWALRSSVHSLKKFMIDQMTDFADKMNLSVDMWGDYPSWPLKPKSNLEKVCVETFKEMFQKEVLVKGIHAGLEGGVFLEKMPHLEAISFGPDMWEVHSINERINIPSVERVYDFLKAVLVKLD